MHSKDSEYKLLRRVARTLKSEIKLTPPPQQTPVIPSGSPTSQYPQRFAPPTKLLPIPAVSQIIPQTLMPAPKPASSPKQLQLQDQLIAACRQGDEKEVTVLFKRGAKPDIPNAKGEQPLGAAVWSMCPDVVNILLKETGGVAPMTWDECEKHNLKYYKKVFIVLRFAPQTYGEWYRLLQKIGSNPFIREFHLKKADEQWHDDNTSSWGRLRDYVEALEVGHRRWRTWRSGGSAIVFSTEQGYVGFRTQIKQGVETASRPTVGKTF